MTTRREAKFEFLDDSGWTYYEPGKEPTQKCSSELWDDCFNIVEAALFWLSGLFIGLWLASLLR